jgi:hypothetical protein
MWWSNQCQELENLDKRGRSDLVYDKVKQLTWGNKKQSTCSAIKNRDGILVTEEEEMRETWREYIEELYDKKGKPKTEDLEIEMETDVAEDEKSPGILDSEVRHAIEEMKNDKAVGVDNIPAEFLKTLGKKGIREMIDICQGMYEEGV